jgi:hypothetical protein
VEVFREDDPYVQWKIDIMRRAMPAQSAVVFGDMYMIDGGYTRKCLELGCSNVLLVDTVETAEWQRARIEQPALDFYKGDFANSLFMQSITQQFDIGVAYEILLHQAPLLHTLHLILEKIRHKICIVQPMLKEQAVPNSLVYLPGNTMKELYPVSTGDEEFKVFDVREVNQSHWLWGMTPSFLRSALLGEGFEITWEEEYPHHPLTENWITWGCIAERRESPPGHWSRVGPLTGVYNADW